VHWHLSIRAVTRASGGIALLPGVVVACFLIAMSLSAKPILVTGVMTSTHQCGSHSRSFSIFSELLGIGMALAQQKGPEHKINQKCGEKFTGPDYDPTQMKTPTKEEEKKWKAIKEKRADGWLDYWSAQDSDSAKDGKITVTSAKESDCDMQVEIETVSSDPKDQVPKTTISKGQSHPFDVTKATKLWIKCEGKEGRCIGTYQLLWTKPTTGGAPK
jgi:hypothetical protein